MNRAHDDNGDGFQILFSDNGDDKGDDNGDNGDNDDKATWDTLCFQTNPNDLHHEWR